MKYSFFRLVALCLGISFAFLCQLPVEAEVNSDLADEYLESQFDWAMYVDAHVVNHYMNYEGSKLKPLTKVRVYFRVFPHSQEKPNDKTQSKVYEEFWYHKSTLVGMRRRNQLRMEKDKVGIVVVGKQPLGSDQTFAIANAVVRVLLDLQFQKIVTSVVQVPSEDYQRFAGSLANYKFSSASLPSEGEQMSIHLRSYPAGADETYYYSH